MQGEGKVSKSCTSFKITIRLSIEVLRVSVYKKHF